METVLGLGLLALFGFVVWMSHGPAGPKPAEHTPESPDAASNGTTSASIPDQLEKLWELHDRGVITKAEFSAKKVELLARL